MPNRSVPLPWGLLCTIGFFLSLIGIYVWAPATPPELVPTRQPTPTRLLTNFRYPQQRVWIENLAVRSCGDIVFTSFASPELYTINPLASHPTPELAHTFSNVHNLSGITETTPDNFIVAGLNFPSSGPNLSFADISGNALFRVAFPSPGDSSTVHVSLITTIPEAQLLNGLTTLDETTVLAADSLRGVIWRIDTHTGAHRIVIDDPSLAPGGQPVVGGVNGLKIRRDAHVKDAPLTLYFTNTGQRFFARAPIHSDGTLAGPVTKIASPPEGALYDDFVLDARGNAFLATSFGNSVVEVFGGGARQVVVAGEINSTIITEPTAVAFGRTDRDRDVLYVSTAGGLISKVEGDEIPGGQLVAIDLTGRI